MRYNGNAKHSETMKEVSLAEFEAYGRARHDCMVWKRMKVYPVTTSDGLHCVLLPMTLALRVGVFNVTMSAALFDECLLEENICVHAVPR